MRFIFSLIFLTLAGRPLLGASETYLKMAVKRGEVAVDPKLLPLAAFTLVLDHAAMPLDSVVLRDRDTDDTINAYVGTFNPAHPNVLTAMQGEHRTLIMVILHLAPGNYEVRSAEFEGRNLVRFKVGLDKPATFEVKPSCVNYVGSLVFSADWQKFEKGEIAVKTTTKVEQSQQRDWKWATNVVPGLAKLPPGASRFEIK